MPRFPFWSGGPSPSSIRLESTSPPRISISSPARATYSACWRPAHSAGYETELVFSHWLAKIRSPEGFIDVIFSSGNGVATVDDGWFEHATRGRVLGVPVKIAPAEETIWSKAFVMERERYDGADVAHLILAHGERLDWKRLLARFGPHWRVLLAI